MNRFAPPKAPVADVTSQALPRRRAWPALVIVTVYLIAAAAFAPNFFALVSKGVYSLLHFLMVSLATLLVLAGAIVLALGRRRATGVFGIATVLACLSLLQQHPAFAYGCVAACWAATFFSWRRFKGAHGGTSRETPGEI